MLCEATQCRKAGGMRAGEKLMQRRRCARAGELSEAQLGEAEQAGPGRIRRKGCRKRSAEGNTPLGRHSREIDQDGA